MSASGDAKCPRCGTSINGMPATSRITDDADIEICGLCASEEAMFAFRNPGVPLPPINEQVPLDLAYNLDADESEGRE